MDLTVARLASRSALGLVLGLACMAAGAADPGCGSGGGPDCPPAPAPSCPTVPGRPLPARTAGQIPGQIPGETRGETPAAAPPGQAAAATPAQIAALIRSGETRRSLGRLAESGADLLRASELARAGGLDLLACVADYGLGQTYAEERRDADAESRLGPALARAETLGRPALTGAIANALGNVYQRTGRTAEARERYLRALDLSREAGDDGLAAAAQRNLAHLSADPGEALGRLAAAREAALRVPEARERAGLLLGVADESLARGRDGAGLAAGRTLEEAQGAAEASGDARLRALALAQRGRLSEARGEGAQALTLTEQAIVAAPVEAHDLLYQWEWRLGRLERARGERARATQAYRRAVDHLERVRHLIPIEYADGRSSFRETLAPLYLGLADLLLLESGDGSGADAHTQQLLTQARDAVEQVKLDELRDYFRDACILPLSQGVGQVSPRAAVLYPIVLPERLELLVQIAGRLYRVSQPVSAGELDAAVAALDHALRSRGSAVQASARLYDWLIAPIEPLLAERAVDTLVAIPDGALRTVPLAALSKDGHYLIERYALATAPGLRLLEPRALPHSGSPALLAGLSQPGPVIGELPRWWVSAMVEQQRRGQAGGGSGNGTRGASVRVGDAAARGILASPAPEPQGGLADAGSSLALPGVRLEIETLSRLMPGSTLFDADFRLQRFIQEVEGKPYRIVHIASHGLFSGKPEESFIVTYDKKLDMRTLASILNPKRLSREPIEILVLSACQTAEGDDRTPLGLSGIALQSGARSALGSLWPVDDAATQSLMRHFYENLRDPGTTKGRALQQAQQALLREGFADPYYWAPFVLVGNWL